MYIYRSTKKLSKGKLLNNKLEEYTTEFDTKKGSLL